MFDIGWAELLFFAVLVLLIMGPAELPVILRHVGRFLAQGRSMMREFHKHIDDMAKDANLDEITDSAKDLHPSKLKSRFADSFLSPDLFDADDKKRDIVDKNKGKDKNNDKTKNKEPKTDG
ncbi:MAG: Sec-independent protein translocase protein TatB [Alphaproteobacteria bacterium]|nr:Sec-independent protein translocase protein TatB [Alphaproteobacteria bacterium]